MGKLACLFLAMALSACASAANPEPGAGTLQLRGGASGFLPKQ
ncbi:hypothetical protein [Methylocystis echinoides]